jgi:hypothetical protein
MIGWKGMEDKEVVVLVVLVVPVVLVILACKLQRA